MEQLQEHGLANIGKAYKLCRKVWWYPPAQSCIVIIPWRELDDPPDSGEAANHLCVLIAVELSESNNEDILLQ